MTNVSAAVLEARIAVLSTALQETVRVLSAAQGVAFANALRDRFREDGQCGRGLGGCEEADSAAAGELRGLLEAVEPR